MALAGPSRQHKGLSFAIGGGLAVVMIAAIIFGLTKVLGGEDERRARLVAHHWEIQSYLGVTGRRGDERRISYTIPPSARRIPIWVKGGYCIGRGKPTLVQPEVRETNESVVITAYLDHSSVEKPPDDGDFLCSGVGLSLPVWIGLDEPLAGRDLIDGRGPGQRARPLGPIRVKRSLASDFNSAVTGVGPEINLAPRPH